MGDPLERGVDSNDPVELVNTVRCPAAPRAQRLAAFGRLVRRFADMAYGCAHAILGDFHLAQDAAQEAFLIAWRRLETLRIAAAFPAWLRRIVVRQCHRLTRRPGVQTVTLEAAAADVPAAAPPPPKALEKREMADRVLAAVRALSEPQRMVTTLFYINGYSQKEIADFLEVPLTTVKKRLHDARHRLKERMIQMVDETLKSAALPDDFADVLVRKAANADELKAAGMLLSYSSRTRPEQFASPENAERAGIYVVEKAGSIQGAGYFNEFHMGIGATVLTCARPNEMGGEAEGVPDPAFVRSFRACFQLARQRGIALAVVHGSQFDHAFCGFVPCFYYPVASLPVEAAKAIQTRAELVEADADQQRQAREAFLQDPAAPKVSAFLGGGTTHCVRQDDRVVGYANVNRGFRAADHYHMPFGHVTDVTVRTRDASLAVIRAAGELAAACGENELCMMQSHRTLVTQTILALGGKYLLRGPCDLPGLDSEMAAIINLAGLTRQLEGEFQRRFAESPARQGDAALSLEMNGQVIGFVARGGTLQIVERTQPTHRRLPRWVLTRLYVGFYGGRDVLAMGPIPWDCSDGRQPDEPKLDNRPLELPDAEAALLAALFPRLWPVAWPDPDVWPWVIGEPHPQYQGEQHKTPQMKARIDALRFPWFGR
jgi:RNA polymerase sigma factor (sigma-70 family)